MVCDRQTDRQTDERLDGWADGQTDGNTEMILRWVLQTLLIVKCFNNEFSDFLFELQISFYLTVPNYYETLHNLNHPESEIKFFKY